jgi:hypothetical protein
MKKLLSIACAVAALAAPALASASSDRAQARHDAIQTCKELRAAAGKKDFKKLYGANAFGKCVSKESHENKAEATKGSETAQKNAAKSCKAERAADPQAFATKYGTGKKGKNAYGKCVSQQAKANEQAEAEQAQQKDDNQVSAAKSCRDEQKADAQAFTAKYGTNKNGRNAYGKCVSKTAHQLNSKGDSQDAPSQS